MSITPSPNVAHYIACVLMSAKVLNADIQDAECPESSVLAFGNKIGITTDRITKAEIDILNAMWKHPHSVQSSPISVLQKCTGWLSDEVCLAAPIAVHLMDALFTIHCILSFDPLAVVQIVCIYVHTLLPGISIKGVLGRVRQLCADDEKSREEREEEMHYITKTLDSFV